VCNRKLYVYDIFVLPDVITSLCLDTVSARMGVGHLLLSAQLPGTHWVMICLIRRLALAVSDVCLNLGCFQSTSTYKYTSKRYAVAEWYGAGLVRLLSVAAVYQRRLSVPSLRDRLMSSSESWGVNGHTTRCTGPVSVVLRLRLVSGWGLMKRRSAPPHVP